MGIGGKINRPRTELKKKLFKRRRELARGGHKKKRRAQAEPPPLWGKRRRKELKRLRAAARHALEAGKVSGKKPEPEGSRDVEMVEAVAEK
ncbi:uncharacterized protein C11orf98 homolog [Cuculus canorus]|uniref:uncharacterized protein C11orf98 homolog n=1 Tax=Cuculus canorus TaxID=55661 RepID=UPI0023AB07A4|nr:uncharacterized protein C11orf98 homolog [Cuculus canorus]